MNHTPSQSPLETPPPPPIKTALIGFAMGSADLVPGVSGGTIAFIAGIYERLITTIKFVTSDVLSMVVHRQFKKAITSIPFSFLIPLAIGIFSAIFTLSSLIGYLLTNQAIYTWSFFMGLIIASIYIVGRRIPSWRPKYYAIAFITTLAAYWVTTMVPSTTPATPIAFFLSGAIAIMAMILPGISGSFLLVIMGKYAQILDAVQNRDIITLGIFMCGAVVGLALFSKLLTYLFKNYHDLTIAALTGLMIGSLNRIWPWKISIDGGENIHGSEKIEQYINILPAINTQLYIAIGFIILGAVAIIFLERNALKKP